MPQLEEYVLKHIAKCNGHIVHGLSFMVTITLKPKLYKYSSITQHDMTINVLKALLSNQASGYVLATELTLSGNVHYHAFVMTPCKYRRITLLNTIKKNRYFGFIKVSNEVHDMSNVYACLTYMIKDVDTTKKILHNANYKPNIINLDVEGYF